MSLAYTTTRDIPPTPGAGTSIASGLAPIGSYDWSIGALADGSYWILAECYNTTGSWDWHYKGPVTVSDIYISGRAWYPAEDISATSSYSPDIAVGPDGTVHIVWRSSGTVYSQRALDGTWSTPTTISSLNVGEDLNRAPRIVVGGDGRVHVAYAVDWPVTEIRYVGLDSGGNIVLTERTVYDGAGTWMVGIAVDGSGRVHIAWVDDVDDGYVYWSRSTDNGANFSSPMIIGTGPGPSYYNGGPGSISASGNLVHVVTQYRDWDAIDEDVVHYFNSPDGGGSWSGASWSESYTMHSDLSESRIDPGADGRVHIIGKTTSNTIVYIASRPPQSCPTLEITEPSSGSEVYDTSCNISWIGSDPDGDNLSVHLYYDTDKDSSAMITIEGAESIASNGSFVWDTSSVPSGLYWIYGEISDGICSRGFYSGGSVYLDRRPNIELLTPPSGDVRAYPSYILEWNASDPEGEDIDVSLMWSYDQDPNNRHFLATGLPDSGEYVWDLTAFEHGQVLHVFAEVDDGVNATVQVEAPGNVIVHHSDKTCVFDSDCPASNVCADGYCVCTPDCTGLECGPEPNCGQICGTCPQDEVCNNDQCCAPDCTGKNCGDDGCSGSCGSCANGVPCIAGICSACNSGPCCSNNAYLPAGTVCSADADSEYGCPWGTECESILAIRYRDAVCTGSSSECTEYANWKTWGQHQACSSTEKCDTASNSCIDGGVECGSQGNRPPPIPILISPSLGSTVYDITPELTIRNVSDPDGDIVTYDFEISDNATGLVYTTINGVTENSSGNTSGQVTAGLIPEKYYKWRARAVDSHNLAGDWSQSNHFLVKMPQGGGSGCGCGNTSNTHFSFVIYMLLISLYFVIRRN